MKKVVLLKIAFFFLWLSISFTTYSFLSTGKINPGVCIQRAV